MENHETVPSPSAGQLLELAAAVLKQLPRDFTPKEAQYWIGHQSRLGEVLRQALKIQDIFGNVRCSIRKTQLSRLIQLGYAEAAVLSSEAFAQLIPVPENKEGALLVISANIVSIPKQMELVGGSNCLDLKSLKDLVSTPKTPYWIYNVENGKKMLNESPDACAEYFLNQDRRGLTAIEGINLVAQYPDVLKDHYVDLPGSRYGAACVPCLRLGGGRPRLFCPFSGSARSRYGSASCGS